MTIFPTQYSTLSAPALADYTGRQYGLGALSGRLLLRGVSDTYLLEGAKAQYIIKVYRDSHRQLPAIQAEVELLNALREKNVAVSWPLTDLQGVQVQPFQAAEGMRYGVVFTYAEGKPALQPTEAQIATTGREMARLHQVAATVQLSTERAPYNTATTITEPLARLAPAFAEMQLHEEYAWLTATGQRVAEYLNAVDASRFSEGYCHYDFLPKNFHFNSNDQLTFFDFDFMGRGWLVNDVMSYWTHFALNAVLGRSSKETTGKEFGIFLDAYQSIRPLTPEEIAAIPYLNFGFWIFYMGFHYDHFDDFSSQFWGAPFVRERVKLIQKLTAAYIPV